MGWPEVISSLANLATAGAVGFGAYVANKGVNAWRRETLGKRKIQLAEQAIPLFSRARAAIREARDPFLLKDDLVDVKRAVDSQGEPADAGALSEQARQYYIPIHRLGRHRDTFAELDGLRPLFTAYFGEETDAWFDAIKKAHVEITAAAETLITMAQQGGLDADVAVTRAFRKVIHSLKEDDKLGQSVKDAQEAIISRCREVLAHKG